MRDALTEAATRQVLSITKDSKNYSPLGLVISEKTIVNGIIGLMATGGSTNHTVWANDVSVSPREALCIKPASRGSGRTRDRNSDH